MLQLVLRKRDQIYSGFFASKSVKHFRCLAVKFLIVYISAHSHWLTQYRHRWHWQRCEFQLHIWFSLMTVESNIEISNNQRQVVNSCTFLRCNLNEAHCQLFVYLLRLSWPASPSLEFWQVTWSDFFEMYSQPLAWHWELNKWSEMKFFGTCPRVPDHLYDYEALYHES